ncbi:hypothetical protein EG347_07340 [Chryseobacterium sp. G0186]|uniref:hypothetical protein n=1 Tax=Chryseobacterium sp. G0186 TaxID=2487064 RepID=UPI000F4FB9E2|nr:hypothetical protein [Chryseobacterium sp. G0186]AZA77334.1 hypothetical protein EG347_07340 [Chryseobacterium sp. G0186]
MMKKYGLLFFIFYITVHFSAQTKKTAYYDANWKETQKSKAVYYRPYPLPKYGNLELLRDYYMKGNVLQMQGYVADGDEKNKIGEVFWFDPDEEDRSGTSYINKTRQKKLTYYFDDGKIWKTIEYGDSLKSGKTIEYKPDGSILGEAIYKNGYLESGTTGYVYSNSRYVRYDKENKSDEWIDLPKKEDKNSAYKRIYYWKNTLKTAVEYSYQNGHLVLEKNFDEEGNLIQQLDSTSYFYPEEEIKNGKYFYYHTQKSAITKAPTYIEYKSFPFSEVSMENVNLVVLYRGTVNFLEKHPKDKLYRDISYRFFQEKGTSFMRLRRDDSDDNVWKSLDTYKDVEATFIPVSEIEALSKEKIFQRFSKAKWHNVYLKNKPISEQLYFSSPDFMGKIIRYSSSGKTETHEKESALIYISLAPGKYMILRKNGGYFIPKNSGDLVEIPNYVQE